MEVESVMAQGFLSFSRSRVARRRQRRSVLLAAAAGVSSAICVTASATDYYWVNGGGGWLDAANHWSLVPSGPPGAAVPGAGDHAIILAGGSNFTLAYANPAGFTNAVGSITLDGT